MENLETQEERDARLDKIIEEINKSTDFSLEQQATVMNRRQRRALQKKHGKTAKNNKAPMVPITIEKNVKQNMQKCLATALHELNRINEENGEEKNADETN